MPKPTKIDRAKLHRHLHRKLGGQPGEIDKVKLAAALGMDHAHLGRIIKELVDAGRLSLIGRGAHNVGIYSSKDPDEFIDGEDSAPKPRVLAWG